MENKNVDCLFCNNGNVKNRLIYKDNLVMAFPGSMPIVPGHVLVCPKRHADRIDELSNDEIVAIKNFIIRLKQALKRARGALGFNIAWNEGVVAGQSVNHLQVHVVPRKEGDVGIYEYEPRKFIYRPGVRKESPELELQKVAELVKRNLE